MDITAYWKLTRAEEHEKAKYNQQGSHLFSTPLTFARFAQLSNSIHEEGTLKFYRETSKNGDGLTVVRNDQFSRDPIYVSRHPRYSYPVLHNHEFVELIYVYHGECINYVDGNAIHMAQGTLCVMAPETVHALVALDDNDIIINVLLYREALDTYLKDVVLKSDIFGDFFRHILFESEDYPYLLLKAHQDHSIEDAFFRLYQESEVQAAGYEEMIALQLQIVFITLLRDHSETAVVPALVSKNRSGIISAIINYIAMNCATITLKELAEVFSYSETYLSKMISKYSGHTFRELVDHDRFIQAQYLIENTTIPLTDISQQVGYFDYSHMSRVFVKVLGKTPRSLRI